MAGTTSWLHSILLRVEFRRPIENPTSFPGWERGVWEPCDQWHNNSYLSQMLGNCRITFYLQCQIAVHQVCMGTWQFSLPPPLLCSKLWLIHLSVILKIQWSAKLSHPPPLQAINNDRPLTVLPQQFNVPAQAEVLLSWFGTETIFFGSTLFYRDKNPKTRKKVTLHLP